jgi:ABC-type Fe3+ transport system permease subunit
MFKMSRTALTGILAAVLVIVCAFFPWATIESRNLVFTGVNGAGSNYGEPGKLSIILSVLAIILFFLRNRWLAIANLFVSGFLVAWTFRNMMLYARCEMGQCPTTGWALYLSFIAALVAFTCVLFTKMPPPPQR